MTYIIKSYEQNTASDHVKNDDKFSCHYVLKGSVILNVNLTWFALGTFIAQISSNESFSNFVGSLNVFLHSPHQ